MHFLLFLEFIGTTELLVVLLVALVVFGPRKLPELGRSLGRALNQLQAASDDFKRTWESESRGGAGARAPLARTDGAAAGEGTHSTDAAALACAQDANATATTVEQAVEGHTAAATEASLVAVHG